MYIILRKIFYEISSLINIVCRNLKNFHLRLTMEQKMNAEEEMKKYAVVKFLSDSTFSEIPTAWLLNDGKKDECWWPPRTANSGILISNCSSPNHLWSKHDIEIVKYCSSLESARKSASDANYQTTDEEHLGRGKRLHVPCSRYSSSGDEEEEEVQPRSSNPKKIAKKSYLDVASPIPSYPDNFGLSNSILNTTTQKDLASSTKEIESLHRRAKNCTNDIAIPSCSKDIVINNNMMCNLSQKSYTGTNEIQNLPQHGNMMENIENVNIENLPIILEGNIPTNDNNQNLNLKQEVQKMLRMQATINLTLKEINQRLRNLETATKKHMAFDRENDNLIANFLPLSTLEGIREFESLLLNTEEAAIQFKDYVLKVRGNNPKDNITRTLKKIFMDECAMKGIRNNFRVGDLHIIRIVKRELTLRYIQLTESDFDRVVAEWLRFAKQRKERADNMRQRDNQLNENNQQR